MDTNNVGHATAQHNTAATLAAAAIKQEETGASAQTEEKFSPSAIFNHTLPVPHYRDEETKFTFKTPKQTEAEKKSGIEPAKRTPVLLTLPVLTGEGLVAKLQKEGGEKTFNYVLDLVNDAIREAARQQVNDEEKPVNTQDSLDLAKLDIEYIAALPKSERGGGISKDVWAAFEADYNSIMPAILNKDAERVAKGAAIFVKRLVPVQSEKPVLKLLQNYLSMWFGSTTQQEEFAEVYQFLDGKITTLLNKDSEKLLEAL